MKMTIAGVTFYNNYSEVVWTKAGHIVHIYGWAEDENGVGCWAFVSRMYDDNILVFKDYDNGEYAVACLEYGKPADWWTLNKLEMYRLGRFDHTDELDKAMNNYMVEMKRDLESNGHYIFPDADDVLEDAVEVIYEK